MQENNSSDVLAALREARKRRGGSNASVTRKKRRKYSTSDATHRRLVELSAIYQLPICDVLEWLVTLDTTPLPHGLRGVVSALCRTRETEGVTPGEPTEEGAPALDAGAALSAVLVESGRTVRKRGTARKKRIITSRSTDTYKRNAKRAEQKAARKAAAEAVEEGADALDAFLESL